VPFREGEKHLDYKGLVNMIDFSDYLYVKCR